MTTTDFGASHPKWTSIALVKKIMVWSVDKMFDQIWRGGKDGAIPDWFYYCKVEISIE